MAQTFDTQQLNIARLFSNTFVFDFPPFQRPYRWEVEHATQLLSDVLLASQSSDSAESEYFLGSIVLTEHGDSFYVIDGRQRLTTVFILLAVLRDLESDEAVRQELHELLYDVEKKALKRPKGFRLRVGPIDSAGFEERVARKGATSSDVQNATVSARQQTMLEVVREFNARLSKLASPARADLRDFLLHKCVVIVVTAKNEAQGLRLFEVMNSRGLKLSEADLMKPTLFTGLDSETQQLAADAWDYAETALSIDSLNRLLRTLCFILGGMWIPPKSPYINPLSDMIKKRGSAEFHKDDLPCYVDALGRVEARELAYTDEKQDPNTFVQSLYWLGRHEGEWSEWLSVAMMITLKAADDEAKLYTQLHALERSFYIMFINDVGEDNRRNVAKGILQELQAGQNPLRPGGALMSPADAVSKAKLSLRQSFKYKNQRGALTRRAEISFCRRNNAPIHPKLDNASVEHVLPRNPLSDSQWKKDFRGKDHEMCLDVLGNAALLSTDVDRRIGQADFARKKPAYIGRRTSQMFEVTKDVCRYAAWTPKEITERTESIARLLEESWGI